MRLDHRHVAPSEDALPFLAHDSLERVLAVLALDRVERQENLADAVLARAPAV